MIFLHLIIAHLLGDFVFQSNDLIQKKYKSWTGTFQHVCIIGTFTVLSLFPYWQHQETWWVIGAIFGVHFVQDCLKIAYDIRFNQKKSTLPFFADQLFHVSLIFLLSPLLKDLPAMALPEWLGMLYSSKFAAIYIIGAILFSYTYDITLYQFLRQRSKAPREFMANIPAMLRRIVVFTLLYSLVLVFGGGLV
ncbi:MAG: DUF3307 domain-containing protein [Patescibacteria group bacterium]